MHKRSIQVAKWLLLLTSGHKVLDLNLDGVRIQLITGMALH